jgi:hypothetical protein
METDPSKAATLVQKKTIAYFVQVLKKAGLPVKQ